MSSTEERIRHEKFQAAIKEIVSSKEKSKQFLQEVGILDKDGQPSMLYYG